MKIGKVPTRRAWLAATAAVVAARATPVRAQTGEAPLRIGSNLGDPYAEAYFAKEAGFFQKAGLTNLELPIIAQGGTMAAAVAGGSLDIAITTTVSIANGFLRNLPFTIIAAGAVNTAKSPSSPLVVAKGSTFREPRDFVGKTIALNGLRAITEVALDSWLVRGGVDVAKVRLIEISFPEMGQAIQRGTVDGALIAEPALSVALHANDLRIVADPYLAIAPDLLVSAWFTTPAFAQKNPDVVKRFAGAIYETGRWANGHHTESAAVLAKYAKVDPEALRTMLRAQYAESLRASDLQPALDAALKYGILPSRVSAADLIFRAGGDR
jgi:NitT/TauT family transport system substrate-binding protein